MKDHHCAHETHLGAVEAYHGAVEAHHGAVETTHGAVETTHGAMVSPWCPYQGFDLTLESIQMVSSNAY
jgi:hypothetical protein